MSVACCKKHLSLTCLGGQPVGLLILAGLAPMSRDRLAVGWSTLVVVG